MISQRRYRLGVLAAIGVGLSVALQSRINGALGARLHDGVAAAVISFGSGLVILCIAAGFSSSLRTRVGDVRRAVTQRTLSPWHCIGGACGAFYVACQGITIGSLGVAVFTIAVVGGQLVSSVWVDRAGIGPGGISPITTNRIVGSALALVAVVIASADRMTGGSGAIALAILPALAGVGLAWQQAVNGRVAAAGGPYAAVTVNFAVGTVCLVVVAIAVVASRGWPSAPPTDPRFYVGGLLGVAHIGVAALIVRWIGVLVLGMAAIAGQLIGALALDALAPTTATLSVTVVVGSLLTLLAVAIGMQRQPN